MKFCVLTQVAQTGTWNLTETIPKLHSKQFHYELHHVTSHISSFWINMSDLIEKLCFDLSGYNRYQKFHLKWCQNNISTNSIARYIMWPLIFLDCGWMCMFDWKSHFYRSGSNQYQEIVKSNVKSVQKLRISQFYYEVHHVTPLILPKKCKSI